MSEVLRDHPRLPRPGTDYPKWVTGCLGDPSADVWFIAENPSATTAGHAKTTADVEDMWTISPGDKLSRRDAVEHGFKGSTCESSGDWRCYITDGLKSAFVVKCWKALKPACRNEVAEWRVPVLKRELALGNPKVLATVGS